MIPWIVVNLSAGFVAVGRGAATLLLADAGDFSPRYRPFLTPIPMDRWWLMLIIPLVVAIAVVYKALKVDELRDIPRQATSLTLHILGFLILAAAGLYAISELA